MKKDSIAAPIIVMIGICLVVSTALAGAHMITSPIIETRAAEAADLARAVVLPSGDTFTQYEETLVEGVNEVYTADNGSGIVCRTATKGFGGSVELMIGVNSDKEITGIQVMNHGETPGVGTNALTEDYLGKFLGESGGDNIDVYSGASLTSRAIKSGVNAAVLQFDVTQGADYEAPIELSEEEIIEEALKELSGGPYELIDADLASGDVLDVYGSNLGSDEESYAILVKGTGHYPEDPFKLLVNINAAGEIAGIHTIYQNETVGFGYEVLTEGTYYEQFIGAKSITKDSGGDGVNIDIVANATETSGGVYSAVSAALEQFAAMK